jgi:probable rRNA maturation factor
MGVVTGKQAENAAIEAAAVLAAEKTLEREGFAEAEADITFARDDEIRKLNKKYRNIDRPTDVLSFPMWEAEELAARKTESLLLGDVIISIDAVQRQAEEFGHSVEREAGFLAAHGVLHLLGYDHMTEEDEKIMRAAQDAALDEAGLTRG